MKRTLAEFARLGGGELKGENRAFSAVNTDTRSLQAGELYLALRGPRFDGNEFLAAALAAGAAGAVVDRPGLRSALPLVVVEDTQNALATAAGQWRSQYTGVVLGVAGSNGKTTVKEMTAAILSQMGSCLATRGNFNNHIGVPLTLLRLDPTDRYAVIEIGANRAGEVAALAAIARPQIALITNAGAEHLEGFGDLAGVAHAEGEMVAALNASGTAVINADDTYASLWRGMTAARVVTFGVTQPADFSAAGVAEELTEEGFRLHFTLVAPQGRQPVTLNVGGRHNLLNALAAAAACASAGASLADIAAGLAAMHPVQGRLQPKRTTHGARLIDDSYNANPSSMRAGIDVLAGLGGRSWLALGDMGELGEHASSSHIDIGHYARARGVERLFATGPLSTLTAEAFGVGATWYPDTEAMGRALDRELTPDVCLLVKGSRSNRLERVVGTLTGKTSEQAH